MRDILVTAIVFGSLPFIFRSAQLGVLMWVWISVMNPHRLTYGFAHDFNFAAIIAVVTLISALLSKDLRRPPVNAVTIALFLLVGWMSVTTIFALHPQEAYDKWNTMMKTQLMALLIPMLFHREEDVRRLIWVIVLSIGYYAVKGAVFMLVTGGSYKILGPESTYIEDNNSLAVAVIMIIPLMRYLQVTSNRKTTRWALTAMMLCCGASVLGSYSRGALLGGAAMVAFLCWKSRHKFAVVLVAVIAIPIGMSLMPEKWHQRMDTIRTYEHEESANMRLNSWGTMYNLAKDRPLVGGGYEVATSAVAERYSPDTRFPPQVAHSIYFQALGEHGFVGLALYLILLWAIWRKTSMVVRLAAARPDLVWARDLCAMIQVTFVGFGVGGAFLNLMSFDVPYYLLGVVLSILGLAATKTTGRNAAPAPGLATIATAQQAAGYKR
jgi:putative inorganic carbon (hco3(-)) transporter